MALNTKELEQLDSFLKHGRFDLTGEGAGVLHNLRSRLAQEYEQQKAVEAQEAPEEAKDSTNADKRDNSRDSQKPKLS